MYAHVSYTHTLAFEMFREDDGFKALPLEHQKKADMMIYKRQVL